jgi:hypothetical protein
MGIRLRSQVSSAGVIVVKGSDADVELVCAGLAMSDGVAGEASQVSDGPALHLGKRYSDEQSGIEVLVSKAGIGPLSWDGRELILTVTKQLPASD